MPVLFTLVTCLAPLGAAPAAGAAPPPVPVECRADEPFDELLEEYESAVEAHRTAVREEEDRKARSALRKQHPGYEFFPRFRSLADAGDGEALLWMIEEARYCGERLKERKRLKGVWCEELVRKHLSEAWFEQAIAVLYRERKTLGEERLEALLGRVLENSERKSTRAAACLQLGRLLMRSKDEAIRARGRAFFERLIEEFGDTRPGKSGAAEYNRVRYLSVGGEPMDFEAKDVDGKAFKLSDFRGKVVVLDFWGFW